MGRGEVGERKRRQKEPGERGRVDGNEARGRQTGRWTKAKEMNRARKRDGVHCSISTTRYGDWMQLRRLKVKLTEGRGE